ncbi:cyanate permease [Streptococcus pneumoniae]|nr:cyanate permease [Streptococcus pneumoniae]
MKKHSLFFVPGIILIGVSLRTPFTVLPIILGNISQGLEVEVSSLGVLTSLPLLLDHRLTYSTNQSAPALSRNLDGWGKCRSHQCPAS